MVPRTYKCPNCGAPIGYTNRCQYCGSVLDWIPTTGVKFVDVRSDTATIYAQVDLPERLYSDGVVPEPMLMGELKNQIAEQVVPFLTFEKNFNIREMTYRFRAKLNVVKNRRNE